MNERSFLIKNNVSGHSLESEKYSYSLTALYEYVQNFLTFHLIIPQSINIFAYRGYNQQP
jgi:hypothetical protein